MAGHDPRYNFSANQMVTRVIKKDQRAHQSKKSNVLEAQARGKVVGTHQEASWPKAVARGGTHSSVDQGGRPTGGPQHRPPVLSNRFQATSLKRFGVLRLL